jgi:soluble lytic murein transglycosylase-like protein
MITGRSLLSVFVLVGLVAIPLQARSDVYVYKDKQGVLNFTNVPTHQGYRRVIKDNNGPAGGPVVSANSYEGLIQSASGHYGIDADLIRAVIKAESNFNSSARSVKGAMGLMQLMPETARLHSVSNVFDPSDNIEGGARHLKLLLGRYQGDLELSLAAYNAGIKAVEKYGGIPPFVETQDYIRRVLRYYETYRGNGYQIIQQVQRQTDR